jgi:hypothetical protein
MLLTLFDEFWCLFACYVFALDPMLHGRDALASVILLRSQNQNGRDLFCNVEAVNQSSNLIVGSQTIWFEKSLPVVQRKGYVITTFWRKVVRVEPLRGRRIGQTRWSHTVCRGTHWAVFQNCSTAQPPAVPPTQIGLPSWLISTRARRTARVA